MSQHNTDFQAAHDAGRHTIIVSDSIEGIQHVLIPPDCSLKSMENLMPAPSRIKAHPSFNDIDGFACYVEEFKDAGSRIFVDDNKYRFTTVFDCHTKDRPAWGDHSSSMDLELSHEWKRFEFYDNMPLSPKKFAEFLEENVAYISNKGDLSGGDLLTMAQTFKVSFKGELDVEETISKGLRKLIIIDDSSLKGKNQKGKELEFPETLIFTLRIFKNHDAYPVKVFLRTRTSKEKVVFIIKIPDPQGLVEEAFDNVIQGVKEATGLPTLKGKFEGPSHRR